jgi:hypothetical protein
VVLALLTAFFAWVSAGPFWLSVQPGVRGTATITASTPVRVGTGPCRATFTASGQQFTVSRVTLNGVSRRSCVTGTAVPARMVSSTGSQAYALDGRQLKVRSALGFLAIVLCTLAITWVTGAGRFVGRQRIVVLGSSLSLPIMLAIGVLVSAR